MIRKLLSAAFVLALVAGPTAANAGVTDTVLDTVWGLGLGHTTLGEDDTPVKGTIEVAKTLTGGVAVVKTPGGEGDYPTQWNCNLTNIFNISCTTGRAAPAGNWSCQPGGPWVYVTMSGTPGSYVHAGSNCGGGDPADCIAAAAGVEGGCSDTGSKVVLTTFSCPITPHVAALEWHVTCHTWDP